MTERRLKHWGWGYEDQAPTATQMREAAEGIRARFGFGGEVEEAGAAGGGGAAGAAAEARRRVWGPVLGRALRAGLARAGQGLPRRRPRLPRAVREPAGPGRLPPRRVGDRDGAELGGGRGRGGDPVRRWHQRRRRGRAAARRAAGRDDGPAPARSRARGRPDLAGGADPGRRHRAAARRAAARARAHPAPLPAVLRVRDPGRLDRHPRRRPLRHPRDPHRRPGRVGAGDHPARHLGEPAAAGLRRRPLAGPDAGRLQGHPRRDRRGLGAGAAAARVQGLGRGRVRRLPGGGAGGARDLPVRPSSRQLPPARRLGGRADRRRQRRGEPADPRLRVRRTAGRRRRWRRRWRSPARTAACPARCAAPVGGRAGGRRGRGRRLARGVPAGALPARHLRRLRGALGDLRDGDHLGPVGGVPRERDGDGAGGGGGGLRRSAEGPGAPGSAAASPTSTRTAPPPTSRSWHRPCAAARWSSGTRSRPPPPRR